MVAITVYSLVSGIFGMNIKFPWNDHHGYLFKWVKACNLYLRLLIHIFCFGCYVDSLFQYRLSLLPVLPAHSFFYLLFHMPATKAFLAPESCQISESMISCISS